MPSLSLQTRWVNAQTDNQISSDTVALGPRGFKSALQSLIKFLIKYEVRANLWLKLPKDDAWWTDVLQYGQQAAGCIIYALGKQDGFPSSQTTENLAASFRTITIEQDSDLKKEYLCVAIADNFAGALLAARVPADVPTPDKRTLRLHATTNSLVLSAVADGLERIVQHSIEVQTRNSNQAIEAGMTQPQTVSDALLASHAMLSQWDRYFPDTMLSRRSWPLSEAYLAWQLQFQEDLRSQLAAYRSAEKNSSSAAFQAISADFLSQAGRELQAPLTTVKTALTLLGSPALKLAQRQQYLKMIAMQCDRQKSLIDSVIQLLQLQADDAVDAQPIQLNELIPGIVSTYQPIAEEHGIMLAYTVPSNLAPVSGVESELKEVLIHLINNSIQSTPQSGRVWVAAEPQDAHFISLTVRDSGVGIAKSDADRMFEPFYRQQPTNGRDLGSGLGLTLAQQLITRIGGRISAESEPEKGTTIKMLLPIHKARNSQHATNTPSAERNILPAPHSAAWNTPAASVAQ